jgi:hypothetical protein
VTNQPFTLGVNYWPRRKAMFWCANFDAGEVKEEFAVIKELGMHLVRIFLYYQDPLAHARRLYQKFLDK